MKDQATEKLLTSRQNGMPVLLGVIALYVITFVINTILYPYSILSTVFVLLSVLGTFLLAGLKVLKPQEAVVLTPYAPPSTPPPTPSSPRAGRAAARSKPSLGAPNASP